MCVKEFQNCKNFRTKETRVQTVGSNNLCKLWPCIQNTIRRKTEWDNRIKIIKKTLHETKKINLSFKQSRIGAHFFFRKFASFLYMFRATVCPSSGENNCIYATLVTHYSRGMTVRYAGPSKQNSKYHVSHKYICFFF